MIALTSTHDSELFHTMPEIPARHPHFFLTHASANILEDLSRSSRLNCSASLLYGVSGVGKSCLIEQFIHSRLTEGDFILLRFLEHGLFDCRQFWDQPEPQVALLDKISDKIPDGAVVVLDQLEKALPDVVSQIFSLWKKQATKNNLKLILICDSQALKSVYEVSQNFNIEIASVEIKTLSEKEQIAYLQSRVCEGLRQQLQIDATVRKSLKNAQGIFARLEKIPQQHAAELKCIPRTTLQQFEIGRHWLSFSAMLVLFIVLGFYFLDGKRIIPAVSAEYSYPENQATVAEIKSVDEPRTNLSDQSANQFEVEIADASAISKDSMADQTWEKNINTLDQDANQLMRQEPELKETTSAVAISENILQKPELNPFQMGMLAMKNWLEIAAADQASIQIMTVKHSKQSELSLNRYLNQLQNLSVDIDPIMIFSSNKKGQKYLGVLYGEYESRDQAVAQITQLPDILLANKPIPRTVKGIKKEIKNDRLL